MCRSLEKFRMSLDEMIDNILRHVPGTLSAASCQILYKLVKSVPKDGLILDLSPGEGRSTVVMGAALEFYEKEDAAVVAVDSHITNPASDRPFEEGTLMRMLTHLRTFRVLKRVIPLVKGPQAVSLLLNKRAVALAVVQVPTAHVDFRQALETGIGEAQFAIRKGGKIVVVCSNDVNRDVFVKVTDKLFAADFKLSASHDYLRVFESTAGAK